ncbi:inactive tyrosine-protein kinase PEAK1-like [Leuresthes tenuis]|uniref:inactive tyrosine-protein kinase PEAK1-like n=1 Tax=Leuresthes tenuis TaxID=355514 RepID=UPI003B50EA76
MASGSGRRAEEQAPALPVKQRRSSSVESDSFTLNPAGLQLQNYANNEVFSEPTDCHAAQCPIHQRYDPFRHQVRFFSDGTPPPVPRKRLTRTLSLPGSNMSCPSALSPLSPLRRCPQNFDNPLYMMAPIPDTYFSEEAEDVTPARGSPAFSPSFSQLCFDTPDEHLLSLFSSFVDKRLVSQAIQHRHLLFLRSMAQSVEARSLLQGEGKERVISSYQPQDFLLCEGSEPRQIGDKIYYSLRSSKFPGRVLGLRVHKQSNEASSACPKHQPSHVNVKDVIAYFEITDILKNNTNTLDYCPSESDCTPCKPPAGSSTESATDSPDANVPTVQSLLQRGRCVSIERDLPQATLEDFVVDSRSLPSKECSDYDRQVCVLLLQILMGSHHLYNNSAVAAELSPQEILLVWPSLEKDKGGNMLGGDASEAWRGSRNSRQEGEMEWEKTKEKARIQALWKTHGSPRVVLALQSSTLSAPQLLTSIKVQIGALIQFCLPPQESPRSLSSVPTQSECSYRRGLLHLSSLIQSESASQMTDMVAVLQVLLWGPQVPLFNHRSSSTTAVHNWLTIKRALLVMKLAERGLVQDQSALDWEDFMCLQYLSFTDSETVVSVATQLWNTLNAD